MPGDAFGGPAGGVRPAARRGVQVRGDRRRARDLARDRDVAAPSRAGEDEGVPGGQGDEAMKRDAGSGGGSAHVDEQLDAFRSGELEGAERARVEEHLAGCARCREELSAAGAWSDVFDRAYAARRAAAAVLEPDWAAQRAEIVARTSAGARVRRP